MTEPKIITLVVSVYNEEANLRAFYAKAREIAEKTEGVRFRFLFVDDGSADGSAEILRSLAGADGAVKVVRFSRNFGHEAAMLAGIDRAGGDAVICMDADLQHPPESIPEMVRAFLNGSEIVNMVGSRRPTLSRFFYKFLNVLASVRLEENASDFFLISDRVAGILRTEYREQARFLRGFIQIVGFRRTVLRYESRPRFAGESKYNFRKLFAFSVNTLASFSNIPLRAGILAGGVTALVSAGMAVYSLVTWRLHGAPPGYTTMVTLLCFLFSINFLLLGIIGEYIGHILYEVKGRPVYIVEEEIG
jgi:dolichol-phosphate mannosyltransferase